MRHRKPRLFKHAALALLLTAATPVTAETLAAAVQSALERDPRYPLHQATRAVGDGYRRQADSLLGGDPNLSLLAKSDQLAGSNHGYQEYEAALSLPLWLPGQRGARRAIADNLDRQADAERLLVNWQVSGAVLEKAWDLRLAQGAEHQAQRQLDSAAALQRDIARRVQAGELPRADRLLAEEETLNRQAIRDDAAAEVEHAQLAWHSLTGFDALPSDLERAVAPAAETQVETPAKAQARHPRLLAALGEADTARAMRDDTRRNRRSRPELTLYAKRDRGTRDEPYTNSVGVEISFSFGSGAHSAPGLAEAEAELTRSQAGLAEVERDLALRRQQAGHTLASAERRRDAAGRRDKLARSRLALARRAFELGEADLYQLLLARRRMADAALALDRSKLQVLRAGALYRHAIGLDPSSDNPAGTPAPSSTDSNR